MLYSRITVEALEWIQFYIAYAVEFALFIWIKLIATVRYVNMTSLACFDSDATVSRVHWLDLNYIILWLCHNEKWLLYSYTLILHCVQIDSLDIGSSISIGLRSPIVKDDKIAA